MPIVDRILNVAGDHEGSEVSAKIESICSLLLLYAAAQAWNALLLHTGFPLDRLTLATLLLCAAGLSVCFAGSLLARHGLLATRIAVGLLVLQFVVSRVGTTNHLLLALWCLLFIAFLGGKRTEEEDQRIVLQGLQWSVALVLLGCGLQKLFAGTWFQGDFIAFSIASGQPLGQLFSWTLPAAEIARLQAIDFNLEGAGPVRSSSAALIAVSNLVWGLEVALPALLLHRKTRRIAVVIAIVFVLGFYLLGAREPLWSLAMSSLLLLFAPASCIQHAFYPIVALYLYVLGMAIGVLPGAHVLRYALVPGRMHL